MTAQRPLPTVPSIFQPTWRRGLFALAVAIAGFFLPQEIPLVWYPLNNPGNDINYLEITCAANITNETQLFLDYGRGFNQLDSIRIPISPSKQAFTYTFPLQDAPLIGLRVDPYSAPGELLITNLRIINRRAEEIRYFNRGDFALTNQIASTVPTSNGWKLVTTPDATDPYSHLNMPVPLVPVGMSHRNLLRCLLSTGYLAGMLLILLLAVLFTFYHPAGWRDLLSHLGFMACLGVLFAIVGNRGLIKNSARYARFIPSAVAVGAQLEVDLRTDHPWGAQLFWDTGQGFNEADSRRQNYEAHSTLQTLRFPLPNGSIKELRFDPIDGEARLAIRGLRIVDTARRTLAVLPLTALTPQLEIARCAVEGDVLNIDTTSGSKDPILIFTPAALALINQTLAAQNRR